MTRDFYLALFLGVLLGFGWGLFAGRFIDRDRDQYIEVYQFEDKRWDVSNPESVTIIQAKPDPEK